MNKTIKTCESVLNDCVAEAISNGVITANNWYLESKYIVINKALTILRNEKINANVDARFLSQMYELMMPEIFNEHETVSNAEHEKTQFMKSLVSQLDHEVFGATNEIIRLQTELVSLNKKITQLQSELISLNEQKIQTNADLSAKLSLKETLNRFITAIKSAY